MINLKFTNIGPNALLVTNKHKNEIMLVSYNTPVAIKVHGVFYRLWDGWLTQTTKKHLKEFGVENKAAWEALPFYHPSPGE